jgi:hypothetical protein
MRKASGHEVVELTPDQLAAWKQAVAPVAKNWAETVRGKGLDPDAVAAELKASLTSQNAAF